jgi:CheY-like chemotaxis protein
MSKCILIVDDDRLARDVLRAHLARNGFRTAEAQNGLEAIEAIRKGGIDAMMPESDGLEVLMWLIREKVDLPVVVITQAGADNHANFAEMAERFGALKSFVKPLSEENILMAIALIGDELDRRAR